ncbi:MAG: hypothetical protein LGB03_05920 [Sulfurovum sp.]|nr:hypothetical protein [Sulfurovum sp.]
MKEYVYLLLTIVALFGIVFIGAIFSPTFEEQKNFLELFYFGGSILFIFSVLIVFATIGFRSFAIYGAIIIASIMALYGTEVALLLFMFGYVVWSFVFSMELLLFYYGLASARKWFKKYYTFKMFQYEYYLFYPMLFITYLFLEIVPSLFYREPLSVFKPSYTFEAMKKLLT